MKNINQIFVSKPHLKGEPEVMELIDYCRDLEDKIIENTQSDVFDKENVLADLVRDIYESCLDIEKEEEKHNRWPKEFSKPNYKESVYNLKEYISTFARDNNFRL